MRGYGPFPGGTFSNDAGNGEAVAWTSPGNVAALDGTFASAAVSDNAAAASRGMRSKVFMASLGLCRAANLDAIISQPAASETVRFEAHFRFHVSERGS